MTRSMTWTLQPAVLAVVVFSFIGCYTQLAIEPDPSPEHVEDQAIIVLDLLIPPPPPIIIVRDSAPAQGASFEAPNESQRTAGVQRQPTSTSAADNARRSGTAEDRRRPSAR